MRTPAHRVRVPEGVAARAAQADKEAQAGGRPRGGARRERGAAARGRHRPARARRGLSALPLSYEYAPLFLFTSFPPFCFASHPTAPAYISIITTLITTCNRLLSYALRSGHCAYYLLSSTLYASFRYLLICSAFNALHAPFVSVLFFLVLSALEARLPSSPLPPLFTTHAYAYQLSAPLSISPLLPTHVLSCMPVLCVVSSLINVLRRSLLSVWKFTLAFGLECYLCF